MNYHIFLEWLGIVFIIDQVIGFIVNVLNRSIEMKKKKLIHDFWMKKAEALKNENKTT